MENNSPSDHDNDKRKQSIEVAVVTTSGSFPEEGFKKVPIGEKVREIIEHAIKELKITDTTTAINIDTDYAENHLSGQIVIDYGPPDGGGGNA